MFNTWQKPQLSYWNNVDKMADFKINPLWGLPDIILAFPSASAPAPLLSGTHANHAQHSLRTVRTTQHDSIYFSHRSQSWAQVQGYLLTSQPKIKHVADTCPSLLSRGTPRHHSPHPPAVNPFQSISLSKLGVKAPWVLLLNNSFQQMLWECWSISVRQRQSIFLVNKKLTYNLELNNARGLEIWIN